MLRDSPESCPEGCKCHAEAEATAEEACGDNDEIPEMFSAEPERKAAIGRKMKLRRGITMDTGAHHCVMPRRMIGKLKVRSSPGSRIGMKYVGAGGERIRNEGEVDFPFRTAEGHKQTVTFQVAEVNKPLGAVAYFVDSAYRVVYDKNMATGEDLSYMIHKPSKTVYKFRRDRNVWILDAIVDIADIDLGFSGPE